MQNRRNMKLLLVYFQQHRCCHAYCCPLQLNNSADLITRSFVFCHFPKIRQLCACQNRLFLWKARCVYMHIMIRSLYSAYSAVGISKEKNFCTCKHAYCMFLVKCRNQTAHLPQSFIKHYHADCSFLPLFLPLMSTFMLENIYIP